jgi:hypothetical protein
MSISGYVRWQPRTPKWRFLLIFGGIVDAGGYTGTTSWRRGRDSNPRYGCPYAAFRVRCIQPLCHLSNQLILIVFLLSHLAARWPFAPFCSQFSLEARLFTAARNASSTRMLGDFFCWIGLCLRGAPSWLLGSPIGLDRWAISKLLPPVDAGRPAAPRGAGGSATRLLATTHRNACAPSVCC